MDNEELDDSWVPKPLVPENDEAYINHSMEEYLESIEPEYRKLSTNDIETNWAVYWKKSLLLKLTEALTEVKVEGALVNCVLPNMTYVRVAVKRAIERHELSQRRRT